MKPAALIAALVLAGCSKPTNESKVDQTKAAMKKLAYEGFPSWARSHPEKQCPDSMAQLLEYAEVKSTKDAWGNEYKLLCGADLPAGAIGVAIVSFGEDKKEGTADDIKSWE